MGAAAARPHPDALTEKHIAADSKLAQFVGVKAYEKAGGAVLRDLFDDDNAGGSPTPRCSTTGGGEARKSRRRGARRRLEMGRDHSRPDLGNHQGFRQGEADASAADRRAAAEIDKLTAEGNAIIDEHGEEPEDDEIADRFYEIQERIAELSEGEVTWPDAAKANAGAVIGIGHDGAAEIRRGLIRPEDKAAARKADKAKNGGRQPATRTKPKIPASPPSWSRT